MFTKLNIGSGPNLKEGWLNIDVLDIEAPNYLQWDIADLGLPGRDYDEISSEHCIEHFTDSKALEISQECVRKLKLGGILRIAVPNFRTLAEAYVNRDWRFFDILNWDNFSDPQNRSLIDVCSYAVYQRQPNQEHFSIWDEGKLRIFLNRLGLKDVVVTSNPDPNINKMDELRTRYTIYGKGTKVQ